MVRKIRSGDLDTRTKTSEMEMGWACGEMRRQTLDATGIVLGTGWMATSGETKHAVGRRIC